MLSLWPWAAAALSGVLLTLCFAPYNQEWLCWVALTPLIAAVLFRKERTASIETTRTGADFSPASAQHRASSRGGAEGAEGESGSALRGVTASGAAALETSTSESPVAITAESDSPTSASSPTSADARPSLFRRLLSLLKHLRPSKTALLGYITGLIYFWGAFSWLTTVTAPGWFILAFYLALYPAIWAVLLVRLKHHAGDFTRSGPNVLFAALGAAAWVALEWIRGWFLTGFGWNGLGVALHANLPLIQIAEFTGIGGLSFLTAFMNLTLALTLKRFIEEIKNKRITTHWDFSVAMALIALVFGFGIRTLFQAPVPSVPLKVAAVQANIPEEDKRDYSLEQQTTERYQTLTETALTLEPNLIIWPEAATPRPLFSNERTFKFVHGLAARADYNLLIGTLDFDESENVYNIAALLTQRGEEIQTYRKMHLVPFGEYIPFRKVFPPFEWLIGDLVPGDLASGKQANVLEMANPSMKAAALVCFEDTLGNLTRQFVLREAQVLVNVTNDGWFLFSQGAEQHLANAVFRTVENRRPLLRAANTGVTAFIDEKGRITHSLRTPEGSHFLEGILAGEVKVPTPEVCKNLTFYTRYGELFSETCAAIIGITLLLRLRRPKK